MQTNKKIVVMPFETIIDKSMFQTLEIMNVRIYGKSIVNNKFKPKLLSPDEFINNSGIREGAIAKAINILLPIAESKMDYLHIVQIIENSSMLKTVLSDKTHYSSIPIYNNLKQKTSAAIYNAFLKDLKLIEDAIYNDRGWIKLYVPNPILINQMTRLVSTAGTFDFRVFLLVPEDEKYIVQKVLSYYSKEYMNNTLISKMKVQYLPTDKIDEYIRQLFIIIRNEGIYKKSLHILLNRYTQKIEKYCKQNFSNVYVIGNENGNIKPEQIENKILTDAWLCQY